MTSLKRVRPYRPAGQATARAFAVLALIAVVAAAASSWLAVRAVQGEVKTRASLTQLCQTGNEFRAQQVQLWTHIIEISAPPPRETAEQHQARIALLASFRQYLRKVFAARDCKRQAGG